MIQPELTWDKRIGLDGNNKAMQEIIIWRDNFIQLNSYVFASYCSYFFRHNNHIIM